MTIVELYAELERETPPAGVAGMVRRRIPSSSRCDLFAAVQKPHNSRAFSVSFSAAALPADAELPRFRLLDVRQSSGTGPGGEMRTDLLMRLHGTAFADVFTSLVEDIIRHIGGIEAEETAATAFIDRLVKWQRFLERHSEEGLSPPEQRGLFGELRFLRDYLLPHLPPMAAVSAWTGPELAAKDFQLPGGCAAEVKTSITRQTQELEIASEKQLDDTGLTALFLAHLSMEPSQSGGMALPQIVQQVRNAVSGNASAASLLEDKLREAGYFDVHESRYTQPGYIEREQNLFRVTAGFPRITECMLPSGVGNVRYSVSVPECRHFAAQPEDLSALLSSH